MRISRKTKNLLTKIFSIVLAVGTLIGAVALVNHFVSNKADDNGLVEVNPKFEVGGLTEYGKYLETKESIYTKEAFECQGLNVSMEFDSTISYQLFFYDKYGDFLYSSSELETDFKDTLSQNVSHARIVITPIWEDDVKDDDKEIKWHQVNKYAKQLTIKVADEQEEVKTYDETLDETATAVVAEYSWQGTFNIANDQISENADAPWHWYGLVDASDYDEIIVKIKTSDIGKEVQFGEMTMDAILLYDITNDTQGSCDRFTCEVEQVEDEYSYYVINAESIDEFYLTTSYAQESGLEMWLR